MTSRSQSISDALGREPVHPFPARMAASVALKAISQARRRLTILDPMMGSGTVLALAKSQGHFASGVDIDPLAVLIGEVWTTPIDKAAVRKHSIEILRKAKIAFQHKRQRDAYPSNADPETKAFLRYWFDAYTRRQLACLSNQIRQCRNKATRRTLWCAFSRLIIAKQAGASLALDLSHSRPHRVFDTAPKKPFAHFLISVEIVLRNCLSKGQKKCGPATSIKLGDARQLQTRSNSIDLVITSPPYLNAIDYMRCSKFSLVWMGHTASNIRQVRGQSIGSEIGLYDGVNSDQATALLKLLRINSKLSSRHKAIIRTFIEDMSKVLRETSRVLAPGGKAIFVIGENSIRGTYVRNAKIISELAKEFGLRLVEESSRTLPPNRRYLPPPSKRTNALSSRMRREVVLAFSKPKRRAQPLSVD